MVSVYWMMKAWWLAMLLMSLSCNGVSRSVMDDSPKVFSGVVSEEEQLQRVKEEFLGSAKGSKRTLGTGTASEAALTSTVRQEYDIKKMIGFRNHVDSIIATPSSPEHYRRKLSTLVNVDKLTSNENAESFYKLIVDQVEYVIDAISNYLDAPLKCIVRNNTELDHKTAEDILSGTLECFLQIEDDLENAIFTIDFENYVTSIGTVGNISTLFNDVEDYVSPLGDDMVEYIAVNVSEFVDGVLLVCNVSNSTELVHELTNVIEFSDCVLNSEDALHNVTGLLSNLTSVLFGDTVFSDTIGDVINLDVPQEHDGRKLLSLDGGAQQIVGIVDDPNSLLDNNQGVGDNPGVDGNGLLDGIEGPVSNIANDLLGAPSLENIGGNLLDDLRDGFTDIITGGLLDGGTVETILGSIVAWECLNDTTSKLEEDENYLPKGLPESRRKFYEVVTDLPNVGNYDDTSPELATYVAIISGGCLLVFLFLIVGITVLCRKMYCKKREGLKNSTHDSTVLPPPLWPEALLFFLSVATAVMVGVSLNFIHKQASEGTNQINDLADYLVVTVEDVQAFFLLIRSVTMNVITTNLEGFLGCLAPDLVDAAANQVSEFVNSTIDDLEMQVPYTELLDLADDFYDAADTIDSTVNPRIAVVLAFTIVSIVAVFCAGLEYALARSKLHSFGRFFSCCKVSLGCVAFCRKTFVAFICGIAILGSCIAFGASAGLLHLISTNCLDPEQRFIDMLPPDSVAARQALEFYLTCEEQEGYIDIETILFQSRCVTSRMQGDILPHLCLEGDISDMEHSLKELKEFTYHVTNRLSCSEVNPLYVNLVHNNICGDATNWAIVTFCTSLGYTFFIFSFCWKCFTDRRRVKSIILANEDAERENKAQMGNNGSVGGDTAKEYGITNADDTEGPRVKVDNVDVPNFSPYG